MNHERAFTLIELLVVIAIISLLVSILLPSLTRAKDLARRAVCLGNLRQISFVMNLYATDNDDSAPSARWHNGGDTGAMNTWYSNMTPWADSSKTWRHAPALNADQAEEYNAFWRRMTCPAQTLEGIYILQGVPRTYGIDIATHHGGKWPFESGYGLCDWTTGQTRKLTEIASPTGMLAFCDTSNTDYLYTYMWTILQSLDPTFYLPARHVGGYAASFVDGHAGPVTSAEIQDPDAEIWRAQ
jgi:prepilin-type N-terminal cleavage/methylation domain-containing protein